MLHSIGYVMPKVLLETLDPQNPVHKEGDVLTLNMADGEQRSGKASWGFLGVYFGGKDKIPAEITEASISLAKKHVKELRRRIEARNFKRMAKQMERMKPELKVQRIIDHFELELETYPKPITGEILKDAARTTAKRAEKVGFMPYTTVMTLIIEYLRAQAEGRDTKIA